MRLKNILTALVDLVYPRRAVCMGCGSMLGCDRDDLCEDCRKRLSERWIGARRLEGDTGLDGTAFAYPYHGPAGGMVRNLKYAGAAVLAEQMGGDIARAVAQLDLKNIRAVTAVPMHPRRLRRRGRNHAELLARRAAEVLDLEYMDLLRRTRNAAQQARLLPGQRRHNLEGAFAVCAARAAFVNGADILLIDDVYTTGATAHCCADALRAAGARRIYFAAYALGEGKHG